jgi:hypothetical protein
MDGGLIAVVKGFVTPARWSRCIWWSSPEKALHIWSLEAPCQSLETIWEQINRREKKFPRDPVIFYSDIYGVFSGLNNDPSVGDLCAHISLPTSSLLLNNAAETRTTEKNRSRAGKAEQAILSHSTIITFHQPWLSNQRFSSFFPFFVSSFRFGSKPRVTLPQSPPRPTSQLPKKQLSGPFERLI